MPTKPSDLVIYNNWILQMTLTLVKTQYYSRHPRCVKTKFKLKLKREIRKQSWTWIIKKSHQHRRIRLFFRRLYFIRHVKERQCRWQNWTTLKDGVCSWLSAAHSLRCFERKKNRLERKREHKWPKVWPFLFKCICLLGTDLWKSQSRVLCSSCFVAIIWSVRI